jgi:glutaredoxin 3
MSARVEIYTSEFCPYCHRAKRLLASKGIDFTEYDVTMDSLKRAEMTERANGRRTVPQVFINGEGVGGSDDLHELERLGRLDALLATAG